MRSLPIAILALLASCGPAPTRAALESVPTPRVLVAVLGGNSSCKRDASGQSSPLGMDMYAPFAAMAERLGRDNGFVVDWLVSCHESDAAVHYVSSTAPDSRLTMTIAQVPDKLATLQRAGEPRPMVLAGHSYGGWLVMKTGLALPADVPTAAFVTIDPISRETCSITRPSGCTQAPTDVTGPQRAQLRGRVRAWHNFYQTRTGLLHSSAIPEASGNDQLDQPHTGIDTDPAVWRKIEDLALQAGRGVKSQDVDL